MKIRMLVCGFVVGAGSILAGTEVLSQDDAYDPAAMEEMMKQWQEIATPGEGHHRLNHAVGEWKVTTRMWMAGPDAPPTESYGTAKTKWIFGGRFLHTEQTGSMMGQQMEGLGIVGFDNYKKKYKSFWIDSLGTTMHLMEGMPSRDGSVITFYGTMDEWSTDEHDKPIKAVERRVNENTRIFEMHDLGIVPGETKVFEMEYNRVK